MENMSRILFVFVDLGMVFCVFKIIMKVALYKMLHRPYPYGMKRYFKLIASDENDHFVSTEFVQGESDYDLTENLRHAMKMAYEQNKAKVKALHFNVMEISQSEYETSVKHRE